jgi:hypothetical protein
MPGDVAAACAASHPKWFFVCLVAHHGPKGVAIPSGISCRKGVLCNGSMPNKISSSQLQPTWRLWSEQHYAFAAAYNRIDKFLDWLHSLRLQIVLPPYETSRPREMHLPCRLRLARWNKQRGDGPRMVHTFGVGLGPVRSHVKTPRIPQPRAFARAVQLQLAPRAVLNTVHMIDQWSLLVICEDPECIYVRKNTAC